MQQPTTRPPGPDPEAAPDLNEILTSPVAIGVGAAALVAAVAWGLYRKKLAKPNADMQWLFQRSPEAALAIMPLSIPSYLGARYVAKRYAPKTFEGYQKHSTGWIESEIEASKRRDEDEDGDEANLSEEQIADLSKGDPELAALLRQI